MSERIWGLRRTAGPNVWYGYWRSRHDAVAALAVHANTLDDPRSPSNGDLLRANDASWFAVEPLEWVDGRDAQLRVIKPLTRPAAGERRNAGGDDGA